MQKTLSAAQCDQLLLNEAKEDNQFRKDLAAAIRESINSFSKALDGMSNSMVQIGAGISRSFEVMAHAMMTPTNQNLFYQNQPAQQGFPFQDPYVGGGHRAFQQASSSNGHAQSQQKQQSQNHEEHLLNFLDLFLPLLNTTFLTKSH